MVPGRILRYAEKGLVRRWSATTPSLRSQKTSNGGVDPFDSYLVFAEKEDSQATQKVFISAKLGYRTACGAAYTTSPAAKIQCYATTGFGARGK
jgi:hypothetical protein